MNDGDLTISVKDKAATFSGKDKYTFDGAIEGTDIKANGNLDVTGASTMNGVTVNGDAAFNKNIEVKGQSKLMMFLLIILLIATLSKLRT